MKSKKLQLLIDDSKKVIKNEVDVESLKKYHKKFMKNNKLIVKTQQRLKNERHNIFTEEIN